MYGLGCVDTQYRSTQLFMGHTNSGITYSMVIVIQLQCMHYIVVELVKLEFF